METSYGQQANEVLSSFFFFFFLKGGRDRNDDGGQLTMAWMSGENDNNACGMSIHCSYGLMERKYEHQGEITNPRKSPAEFCGRVKTMKEKNHKKTT